MARRDDEPWPPALSSEVWAGDERDEGMDIFDCLLLLGGALAVIAGIVMLSVVLLVAWLPRL